MKGYNKNKESSYFNCWNINNTYGWPMSQSLPIGSFTLVQNTSQFSKDFIKTYNECKHEGYFQEVHVQCPEKLHDLHNDLPIYLKE